VRYDQQLIKGEATGLQRGAPNPQVGKKA